MNKINALIKKLPDPNGDLPYSVPKGKICSSQL